MGGIMVEAVWTLHQGRFHPTVLPWPLDVIHTPHAIVGPRRRPKREFSTDVTSYLSCIWEHFYDLIRHGGNLPGPLFFRSLESPRDARHRAEASVRTLLATGIPMSSPDACEHGLLVSSRRGRWSGPPRPSKKATEK